MKSWIENVIKYRKAVIALILLVTVGFMSQLKELKIIIDADDSLPQNHPYVVTNNLIEKVFGNKYSAVIGFTATEGTIYNTHILEKVYRISEKIKDAPGGNEK